jgi:hypothetical protein
MALGSTISKSATKTIGKVTKASASIAKKSKVIATKSLKSVPGVIAKSTVSPAVITKSTSNIASSLLSRSSKTAQNAITSAAASIKKLPPATLAKYSKIALATGASAAVAVVIIDKLAKGQTLDQAIKGAAADTIGIAKDTTKEVVQAGGEVVVDAVKVTGKGVIDVAKELGPEIFGWVWEYLPVILVVCVLLYLFL